MANVHFRKGLLANMPEAKVAGTLYITTDERAIYLDVNDTTRIRLGDFIRVDSVAALPAAGADATALYYAAKENVLCRYDSTESKWIQINTDTGATSIELAGSGAKVTGVSYDKDSRKITVTLGALEAADIPSITHEKISDWDTEINKVIGTDADTSAADTIKGAKALANEKVASVGAKDGSVVVDSTDATAPKVGVQLSAKARNALVLNTAAGEEGLFVPTPDAADTYKVVEAAAAETGYLKTYVLNRYAKGDEENGAVTECGKINIPKDFLVKSASVAEVTAEDKAEGGKFASDANFQVEDKYIDFVINVKSGTATDEHVYLNVKDLAHIYTKGNGIDISSEDVVSVVVDAANANGLAVDASGLKLGLATANDSTGANGANGAMSAADKTKLDKISNEAKKVEASDTNGNIKIDGAETTVYTLPTASDTVLGGVKGSEPTAAAGGVTIGSDGAVSVDAATTSVMGAVKLADAVKATTSEADTAVPTENAVRTAIDSAVTTAMTWEEF